jgi:hypothetical protein
VYAEEFITEEAGMVKYRRTETIEPYGEVTVEIYLTTAYLDGTQKNVIENYLNCAVADILTRQGVTRGAN